MGNRRQNVSVRGRVRDGLNGLRGPSDSAFFDQLLKNRQWLDESLGFATSILMMNTCSLRGRSPNRQSPETTNDGEKDNEKKIIVIHESINFVAE